MTGMESPTMTAVSSVLRDCWVDLYMSLRERERSGGSHATVLNSHTSLLHTGYVVETAQGKERIQEVWEGGAWICVNVCVGVWVRLREIGGSLFFPWSEQVGLGVTLEGNTSSRTHTLPKGAQITDIFWTGSWLLIFCLWSAWLSLVWLWYNSCLGFTWT